MGVLFSFYFFMNCGFIVLDFFRVVFLMLCDDILNIVFCFLYNSWLIDIDSWIILKCILSYGCFFLSISMIKDVIECFVWYKFCLFFLFNFYNLYRINIFLVWFCVVMWFFFIFVKIFCWLLSYCIIFLC